MKLSIVIPVYNCREYLCECVDSILTQKAEFDYEIILIDDGSLDRSGEICDSLAQENDCVKSFHKKNGGAASARNLGIEKSAGDYLMFIDGDDTLADGVLKHISEVISANRCDMIVYGMSLDYYRKGNLSNKVLLSCQFNGLKQKSEMFCNFKRFFDNNALSSACNKVFQSAVIEECNLRFVEGMTLYEDLNFVINYLAHSDKIFFIPEPYYHYRIDADSQNLHSRVSNIEKLQSNLELLLSSMIALNLQTESAEMLNVGADLYVFLLDLNLLYSSGKINEQKESVQAYCNSSVFAKVLEAGASLHPRYKELITQIRSNQFNVLQRGYGKRKLKLKVRRKIKRIIQKVR